MADLSHCPATRIYLKGMKSQATPISVRLGGGTESLTWSLKPTETKNSLLAGQPTTTQRNTDNQANKPEIVSSVDTIDDPIEEGSIPAHNLTAAKPTGNFEPIPDSFDPIESFSPRNAANSKSKGLPLASTTGKSGVNGSRTWSEMRNPSSEDPIQTKRSSAQKVDGLLFLTRVTYANVETRMMTRHDHMIPEFFVCYRCQIHKGMGLEDIWKREDDINIALEGLRGLAIFRRTLQIIYNEGLPPVLKDLALRLEVDLSTVSQIKHRLENENFIRANLTTFEHFWNLGIRKKKFNPKGQTVGEIWNVEDDVMKNLGEDETMSSGSISSLSPTTSPSPVVRGDMSRKREAPTKEAGDGQSPMNTTPKHILAQSSQPSITEDAVMHDASQLQHLEEVNDNSLMVAKNKSRLERKGRSTWSNMG
ncbi:hypothetical protein KEM48_012924 [Puccinia striiformis f. sp. tritici PST-130]|nr:hypothetical protein KEM48_012924 [Puccinia striiformis f. sp. tritici PST-130]